MFENRIEAGKALSEALAHLKTENTVGLALQKGGVLVANEIFKSLHIDFALMIIEKFPFPQFPESDFGAIAEDGSTVLLSRAAETLPNQLVEKIIEEQKRKIERRIQVLRGGLPLPKIKDKIVILVDDGITLGSTMRASIKLCKKRAPHKIVVASPVSSPEVASSFRKDCSIDETIILEQPKYFRAVAQVYAYWRQIPDHEVIPIIKKWQMRQF